MEFAREFAHGEEGVVSPSPKGEEVYEVDQFN